MRSSCNGGCCWEEDAVAGWEEDIPTWLLLASMLRNRDRAEEEDWRQNVGGPYI